MAVMTVRLPDDKHNRLKSLAAMRNVSLNKLIEEFSTIAIAEYDSHNRFMLMAKKGNPKKAIAVLNRLDKEADY